jgi:NADPH-dependent curcumin reductase CurA
MISQYNLSPTPIGPYNLFLAVPNRLKLQGFIVRDHYDMVDEFYADMSKWIGEGKIKWRETVFEGLGNAPKGLCLKEKILARCWLRLDSGPL